MYVYSHICEYESIYMYNNLPFRVLYVYFIKESALQYKQTDFMVVLQKLLPSKRINNSCFNQSQI